MNRQQWNDDLKAQARALYLADGSKLAAAVTHIPQRTIQRWARTQGWDASPDGAGPQPSEQPVSPDSAVGAGVVSPAKGNGAIPPPRISANPTRELALDLALAREVFRLEVQKVRDGKGSLGAYRDASVALGILTDKASRAGVPGVGHGGEFTWEQNHAQAVANLPRIREMARFLKERAEAAQRGEDGT